MGDKSPTKRIASLTYPEGLAIDAHDNLYVAWNEEDYTGQVDMFDRGPMSGKDLGISTGQTRRREDRPRRQPRSGRPG